MQVQPVAKISTLSDPVVPFFADKLTNIRKKIEWHRCSIHLHLVPILRKYHYFCISLYELDFLITQKSAWNQNWFSFLLAHLYSECCHFVLQNWGCYNRLRPYGTTSEANSERKIVGLPHFFFFFFFLKKVG